MTATGEPTPLQPAAEGSGPPSPGPALAVGQRLGEWVLEAPLGAGAFGAVWAARHNALPDRRAAVKVPHDPGRARALREEGALQVRLTDPHVVGVLGLDPDHDPPYLAVELVEPGSSLRALLAQGPLPRRQALALARDVARGLAAAHAAGVVHRDLKPENVLVDGAGRARVADFGLGLAAEREAAAREAALLESESLRSDDAPAGAALPPALAGAGAPGAAGPRRPVGTPRYMAPEQRAGGEVGPPADVHALGVVLFELLTGVAPGGGEVPSDVAPGLDPALDALFRALCARDPARRPTAADAARALDDLQRGEPARPRAPRAASLLWRASALGLDALPVALLTLGPLRGPRLVLAPLLLVAYDAVCALVLGRSLGKRLLGLALVTPGGRPLDPLAAFTRAVLRGLSLAPLGLGYAPALLGLGPALHDHLAQSRVVHEPPAA